MVRGLRKKSISGFIYKLFERIGTQVVSLLISVILARLLEPSEFGVASLAEIFVLFFNIAASYGFGNSLIQKKDADEIDVSTALIAGVGLSVFLYCILFVSSPLIEIYYGYEKYNFTWIIRTLGTVILISPIRSVLTAIISKEFKFNLIFVSSLLSIIISGIAGVSFAYAGFGTWALVFQYVIGEFVVFVSLWILLKWRPIFKFSFVRFKNIWGFGWKLIIVGIMNTLYTQIRSLVISKKYTAEDLAYFNKGLRFARLAPEELSFSLTSVLFPAFSTLGEKDQLFPILRQCVKISNYICIPIIFGLCSVADTLTITLFTEKWASMIDYLRIFCLSYVFYVSESIQSEGIKSLGRTDILLWLSIVSKGIGVLILVFTFRYGMLAISVGYLLSLYFEAIVFSIASKKIYGYKFIYQLQDIYEPFLLSSLMSIICVLMKGLRLSSLLTLILQVLIGIVFYLISSIIMKVSGFSYCVNIARGIMKDKGM